MLFCVLVNVLELERFISRDIDMADLVVLVVLLLACEQGFQERHVAEALVWEEDLAYIVEHKCKHN